MKRVEINEIIFKKLIDGVKHCVSKDGCRPGLEYIQIKIKRDTITAYATDGFRASRVEIKNTCLIDEEFTCLIKPFTVKTSKNGTNPVVVEQSNKKTFVEVITEYGVLRYGFDIPVDEFFDIDKVYAFTRPHDRELSVKPRHVIEALKALNGIDDCSGAYRAVFEIKENNKEAFIIRAKNEDIINEQLILPVRVK